jgi:hypothetical protein
LAQGFTGDDVLRRANAVGSFAGSMRTNLVSMLDGIGLHEHLGLVTTSLLFGERSELVHSTSAIMYPTFVAGENYGGSPPPERVPILQSFVDQVLPTELGMVPDAAVIPLGKTVVNVLRREAARGAIRADRCLFDFPHPSGQNGHRLTQYHRHRLKMAAQVAGWTDRA